jgi:hypothetical protein
MNIVRLHWGDFTLLALSLFYLSIPLVQLAKIPGIVSKN